jgi:hypothetical protein
MAWFIKIILKDVTPSNVILESNLRIAIDDDMAIPYRICSIKNTSICGAILFTGKLNVIYKVTNNKLDEFDLDLISLVNHGSDFSHKVHFNLFQVFMCL